MKQKFILTISMLLLLCGSTICGQTIDTTNQAITSTQTDTLTGKFVAKPLTQTKDYKFTIILQTVVIFHFQLFRQQTSEFRKK